MIRIVFVLLALPLLSTVSRAVSFVQTPDDSGFHPISVTHADGNWTISGNKNTVILNEETLAVSVKAGARTWNLMPSSSDDLLVGVPGNDFHLKLTDAGKIQIAPFRTGYKTGVKLIFDQFRNAGERMTGTPLNLRIVLTMCLEGNDEDLVADAMAIENSLTVRELNWPKEVDGRQVDFTVFPS